MRTILFAVVVIVLSASSLPAMGPELVAKADPWVLDSLANDGETELLVFLVEQADLSSARGLGVREERIRFVVERLRATAERTQGPITAMLDDLRADYRPYWVANMIWVRADEAVAAALAGRPDVARLGANPNVAFQPWSESTTDLRAPEAVEWGVQRVGAPDFWAAGFTGQGIVVAGQDTGYDWDHEALVDQYRGWDGASASHDYNWHDAIHSGGGSCGPDSPEPCDDHGHGTHTMGTMVGDDGGSNQIGVAPGARWIGCRNMNVGNGTPTTYSECFQFFIAPTDLAGQNPDPSKAPHVINNSWTCPPSEGCTDPNILRTVVENVRAAGIVVVVSAGNAGSSCSTVEDPPAIYDASFTVGSIGSSGGISGFSSRGPVTVDGSDRLKPDIVAPGSNIRSANDGGGYTFMSGTSMAGPHVAGVTALVMSRESCLAGDPDALESHLRVTAVERTTTQGCGGDGPTDVPNNTFGWGEVRADTGTCTGLFADGFESGDTSAWDLTIIE